MMNTPTGTDGVFLHSERVSYDTGINAGVVVNAGAGDDKVAFDDTSSVVTVNGEDGDDLFQIGQIVGGRTERGRQRHRRPDLRASARSSTRSARPTAA